MVLSGYAQAAVGGLVAGLAALQTAVLTPGITISEGIVIVFAVLAGAGLVAATPDGETIAVMKQIRSDRKDALVRRASVNK